MPVVLGSFSNMKTYAARFGEPPRHDIISRDFYFWKNLDFRPFSTSFLRSFSATFASFRAFSRIFSLFQVGICSVNGHEFRGALSTMLAGQFRSECAGRFRPFGNCKFCDFRFSYFEKIEGKFESAFLIFGFLIKLFDRKMGTNFMPEKPSRSLREATPARYHFQGLIFLEKPWIFALFDLIF